MDKADAILLRQLYTRMGTLMEDACHVALKLGGPESSFDREVVAELQRAARQVSVLLDAAQAISE